MKEGENKMKFNKIVSMFLSMTLLFNTFNCKKVEAIDIKVISAGIICAGTVITGVKYVFDGARKLCKVYSDCQNISDYNKEIEKYKGYRSKQEATKRIRDISEGKSLLKIYGQDIAKSQCLDALAGCIENIYSEIAGTRRPSDKRGNVIYMIGRSGVGKTTMAKSIADALLNYSDKTCFFIDSGQINREQPLGEQIFKLTNEVVNLKNIKTIINYLSNAIQGKERADSKETYDAKVASALLEHLLKWSETVVIIDEFEKMKAICTPPDSIPEYQDKSADEIIKSIAANGYYMIGTEKVDCSKTLFIITTNETREQLNENFGQGGDIGGGVQRLNIIEFSDLSMDCCRKIINDMVDGIRKTLTNPNNDYKIKDVEFPEETLNEMATFIFNDKVNQARAKNFLENKIYRLFLYNMAENEGKSFVINYVPSQNNEIGNFLANVMESPNQSILQQQRIIDFTSTADGYNDYSGMDNYFVDYSGAY